MTNQIPRIHSRFIQNLRSWALTLVLLFWVGLSGCVTAQNSNQTQAELSYIGLKVDEARELARKNQVPFRVVEIDGKPLAVTMDHVPGRVNAATRDGNIIRFSIE